MVLRALQQITLEHMTQPIAEIVGLSAINAPATRSRTTAASLADRPDGAQT
jgi:hypothetical protein